ncbi:female-specific histamine-binding protein 2-like [Rhipicephalus microplus]|uniref:female-specific histamine-binding protein 2-like n=1 Tax=Rhipicephalus microplus TaxID=6941 RepID=UPI003F6B4EEE
MKLVLLFAALVVALSEIRADKPAWADEAANGAHQDAWRSLKSATRAIYHMVKATTTMDPLWGDEFSCFSVLMDYPNEDEKSVQAYILFLNNNDTTYQFTSQKVTAVKMYGYDKENAMHYEGEDGQNFTDVLAFTGDYCAVFYTPAAEGIEEGYELWATEYQNVSTTCLEKFDEYSKGLEVRDTHTSECNL